jgi:hypothetical protein
MLLRILAALHEWCERRRVLRTGMRRVLRTGMPSQVSPHESSLATDARFAVIPARSW